MDRRPLSVRQLFGDPVASPRRIALALRAARTDVCDWCDLATTPYSVKKLSEAMADGLPALLEVGLAELLARRWLTAATLPGPWRQTFDLPLRPSFELLGDGLMQLAVDIRAQIILSARSNDAIVIEPKGASLQLNNASGWLCKAALNVESLSESTEGQGNHGESVFAEVEGEIMLPLVIATRAPFDGP